MSKSLLRAMYLVLLTLLSKLVCGYKMVNFSEITQTSCKMFEYCYKHRANSICGGSLLDAVESWSFLVIFFNKETMKYQTERQYWSVQWLFFSVLNIFEIQPPKPLFWWWWWGVSPFILPILIHQLYILIKLWNFFIFAQFLVHFRNNLGGQIKLNPFC